MKKYFIMLVASLSMVLSACSPIAVPKEGETLVQARQEFQTTITRSEVDDYPAAMPPGGILELVQFASPVGELDAYITPDPDDGQKHPAIIWLVGGWDNSISSTSWDIAPQDNDQSGSAFRHAGMVMMYPSRRGGNENQNSKEGWYGEIDDIISAYDYLSNLSYVDPDRIYLGGHSTGGSQAILVAECFDKFRAVFSFGPKGSVKDSDSSYLTFDYKNPQEVLLRSPISWVSCISTPTYIFEGAFGNADFVRQYVNEAEKASKSDLISGYVIDGADHFNILAPLTPLVAQKILDDTGETVNISFTDAELTEAMANPPIITKDFTNKNGTYKISLAGDWEVYETESPDSLSINSMDEWYYIDIDIENQFNDIDTFINDFKNYDDMEDKVEILEINDVWNENAKTAKQFIYTYEDDEYGMTVSCVTLLETDNAIYFISVGAYEEAYTEMEKDLKNIHLNFSEI